MNPTLQHLMVKARQLSGNGQLQQATAALQRTLQDALGAAGLPTSPLPNAGGPPYSPAAFRPAPVPAWAPSPAPSAPGAGEFREGSHTHQHLTRRFKLYLPASSASVKAPRALVVMLHGCTQNPDDFASGT
eukprot:gene53333-71298_t